MLALCIRLLGEVVLRRYTLPIPTAKHSLLAKYGHELLNEARETLRRLPDGHRCEAVDTELLPEASGHACVYSAARRTGVSQVLLKLY